MTRSCVRMRKVRSSIASSAPTSHSRSPARPEKRPRRSTHISLIRHSKTSMTCSCGSMPSDPSRRSRFPASLSQLKRTRRHCWTARLPRVSLSWSPPSLRRRRARSQHSSSVNACAGRCDRLTTRSNVLSKPAARCNGATISSERFTRSSARSASLSACATSFEPRSVRRERSCRPRSSRCAASNRISWSSPASSTTTRLT